ncbi:MAG: hypothetical protein KKF62_06935 [Bacteroidetes bacterium]|nr:hypothetical protein [Bacteroidota bacterium]MBU1116242.1 hypothetical protein [Bacteroidota bacterium]MBU1799954.1 hypothetical protein [Bacteroidota bacterium]
MIEFIAHTKKYIIVQISEEPNRFIFSPLNLLYPELLNGLVYSELFFL